MKECGAGRRLSFLITVGKEAAAIGAYVKQHSDIPVVCCETREQAVAEVEQNRQEGDWILVKGSRGMHMDEVVEQLIKE